VEIEAVVECTQTSAAGVTSVDETTSGYAGHTRATELTAKTMICPVQSSQGTTATGDNTL
jgi:hypothetical protein